MPVIEGLRQSVELRRPCETADSVLDVDFKQLVSDGIDTLFLDAESTFVPYDGIDVPVAMQNKLLAARSAGIKNIAIITNKEPKTIEELCQLYNWSKQIRADLLLTPQIREHRKGNSIMLEQAMQYFGATKQQSVMIGDKYSDVIAANNAGVRSIKVRRFGWSDHPGDRLLKRPVEGFLHISGIVKKRAEPLLDYPHNPHVSYEIVDGHEVVHKERFAVPAIFATYGKIPGYGAPLIELDAEHRAHLPPPRNVRLRSAADRAKQAAHIPELHEYLYENGGEVADKITAFRRYSAHTGNVLYFGGVLLDKKWLRRVGLGVSAVSQLLDAADGYAARRDKRGLATKERIAGADEDQRVDKEIALGMSGVLLATRRMPLIDLAVQTLREYIRNNIQKPYFKRGGYDTKATLGTKAATGLQTTAFLAAMSELPTHRVTKIHRAATAAKVITLATSPRVFHHRMAKKQLAERILNAA